MVQIRKTALGLSLSLIVLVACGPRPYTVKVTEASPGRTAPRAESERRSAESLDAFRRSTERLRSLRETSPADSSSAVGTAGNSEGVPPAAGFEGPRVTRDPRQPYAGDSNFHMPGAGTAAGARSESAVQLPQEGAARVTRFEWLVPVVVIGLAALVLVVAIGRVRS